MAVVAAASEAVVAEVVDADSAASAARSFEPQA